MGDISRVGVVGSGIMGAGIAEVCARAGLDVLVAEVSPEAARAGRDRVAGSLRRAVHAGKLTQAGRDHALSAIRFTTDLAEFADRELVIEAVTERAEAKSGVLATLDEIVTGREAILASNTSSIPIMRMAMATSRAPQVIGIHFFNPVPVLDLVELIPCLLTSEETYWRADAFITATLGKTASAAQTEPDSSSTHCSSRTCWLRSGCSSPASRPPRTSTPGWCSAAGTRWARCG
jgi:3-hydroxybutyryl-CoA dehydrogenase